MGKISTQSERCENMSLAKVPNKYLSPSLIYQSEGITLLPPEHVAKLARILKRQKTKEKAKGEKLLPRGTSFKVLVTARGRVL